MTSRIWVCFAAVLFLSCNKPKADPTPAVEAPRLSECEQLALRLGLPECKPPAVPAGESFAAGTVAMAGATKPQDPGLAPAIQANCAQAARALDKYPQCKKAGP